MTESWYVQYAPWGLANKAKCHRHMCWAWGCRLPPSLHPEDPKV